MKTNYSLSKKTFLSCLRYRTNIYVSIFFIFDSFHSIHFCLTFGLFLCLYEISLVGVRVICLVNSVNKRDLDRLNSRAVSEWFQFKDDDFSDFRILCILDQRKTRGRVKKKSKTSTFCSITDIIGKQPIDLSVYS